MLLAAVFSGLAAFGFATHLTDRTRQDRGRSVEAKKTPPQPTVLRRNTEYSGRIEGIEQVCIPSEYDLSGHWRELDLDREETDV